MIRLSPWTIAVGIVAIWSLLARQYVRRVWDQSYGMMPKWRQDRKWFACAIYALLALRLGSALGMTRHRIPVIAIGVTWLVAQRQQESKEEERAERLKTEVELSISSRKEDGNEASQWRRSTATAGSENNLQEPFNLPIQQCIEAPTLTLTLTALLDSGHGREFTQLFILR